MVNELGGCMLLAYLLNSGWLSLKNKQQKKTFMIVHVHVCCKTA